MTSTGVTDFIVAGPPGQTTAGPAGSFTAGPPGQSYVGEAGHVPIDTRAPLSIIDTRGGVIPYEASHGVTATGGFGGFVGGGIGVGGMGGGGTSSTGTSGSGNAIGGGSSSAHIGGVGGGGMGGGSGTQGPIGGGGGGGVPTSNVNGTAGAAESTGSGSSGATGSGNAINMQTTGDSGTSGGAYVPVSTEGGRPAIAQSTGGAISQGGSSGPFQFPGKAPADSAGSVAIVPPMGINPISPAGSVPITPKVGFSMPTLSGFTPSTPAGHVQAHKMTNSHGTYFGHTQQWPNDVINHTRHSAAYVHPKVAMAPWIPTADGYAEPLTSHNTAGDSGRSDYLAGARQGQALQEFQNMMQLEPLNSSTADYSPMAVSHANDASVARFDTQNPDLDLMLKASQTSVLANTQGLIGNPQTHIEPVNVLSESSKGQGDHTSGLISNPDTTAGLTNVAMPDLGTGLLTSPHRTESVQSVNSANLITNPNTTAGLTDVSLPQTTGRLITNPETSAGLTNVTQSQASAGLMTNPDTTVSMGDQTTRLISNPETDAGLHQISLDETTAGLMTNPNTHVSVADQTARLITNPETSVAPVDTQDWGGMTLVDSKEVNLSFPESHTLEVNNISRINEDHTYDYSMTDNSVSNVFDNSTRTFINMDAPERLGGNIMVGNA